MKQQKLTSGVYVVKGGKWRDKVNGNTYFTAYVLDENNKRVLFIPYQYGYYNMFYYEAVKELKKMTRKNAKLKIINGGCGYYKKSEMKNYLY